MRPHALHPLIVQLKSEAKRRRWTAYYIGQASGLSAVTVRRIFNGNGNPTIDTLQAISKVLGGRIVVIFHE